MLENYLRRGARILWDKESDDSSGTKAGTIVDQNVISGTMVYKGKDHIAKTGFLSQKVTYPVGGIIGYNWLNYKYGYTTKMPLTGDTLTGWMSGCYIVTWTQGGQRYVGHIGTIDPGETVHANGLSSDAINTNVKATFGNAMQQQWDVKGYKPYQHKYLSNSIITESTQRMNEVDSYENLRGGKVHFLSLVTAAGQFYSIVLQQLHSTDASGHSLSPTAGMPIPYVVLDQIHVSPLKLDALRSRLV